MCGSTRWIGWTAVVLAFHMSEQLMFGTVELQRLKAALTIYDRWFPSFDAATVTLVMIVAVLVYLAIFSIMLGGRARLVALEVLGLLAFSEVHHVVESIAAVGYTPGLVTSIPYMLCGLLLMRSAALEWWNQSTPINATARAAA